MGSNKWLNYKQELTNFQVNPNSAFNLFYYIEVREGEWAGKRKHLVNEKRERKILMKMEN